MPDTIIKARGRGRRMVAWAWALGSLVILGMGVPRLARAIWLELGATTGRFVGARLAPAGVRDQPIPALEVRDGGGQVRTLDLSGRTAIVFIYDRECGVCHRNMPRWIELILTARQLAVPTYALSRGDAHEDRVYWSGLAGSLETYSTVDSTALNRIFGATGTPCTALVRDGRIAAVFQGIIDPSRHRWLADHMAGGAT